MNYRSWILAVFFSLADSEFGVMLSGPVFQYCVEISSMSK